MDATCIAAVALFRLTPAFRLGFVMTTEWALALMIMGRRHGIKSMVHAVSGYKKQRALFG